MNKILNIDGFSSCINAISSIAQTGDLITKDDKTNLVIWNGTCLVACLIPELKVSEPISIDMKKFQKLIATIKSGDTLELDIKPSETKAIVTKKNTKRNYSFPNLNINEDMTKYLLKVDRLEPKNQIKTTNDWLVEQINCLIFKENDKLYNKVMFVVKKDSFTISDKNETSGTTQISLLAFDEYKLDYIKDSITTINWKQIEKSVSAMKQLSTDILIKLDDAYPIKLIAYKDGYKISVILAPLVENT